MRNPFRKRKRSRIVSDLTMRDTAFPNDNGPETDIMLIYVGGDTPHVWTNADIASMDERYFLPTWVRSNPAGFNGQTEANALVAWLHSHNVPKGVTICLDLEVAIDSAYVNAFNTTCNAFGYKTMKYGSKSSIFSNPKTDGGTFIADPTGTPHMLNIGDCVATQYAFDGSYDLSLVKDTVPLWKAGGNGPPPPDWTETMINNLPTEALNSTGKYVRRIQGLCNASGQHLTIDGVFGPITEAGVKHFQAISGLAQDGIVGRNTWTALVAS